MIAGIVFGLMGLKALILFSLGRLWKLGLDQRFLFALSLAQGSEFAFVLFGFGISEGVISRDVAQILIAGVALTMAMTPLVMVFEEKVLRKRFGTRESDEREADAMEEEAPVILAGIGRFGNFVARMLRSQQIGVTVIDNDSDHIEFLRKLGIKAFYGDANRHDLLEAAGAANARLLIITLDDEEKIHELIETARKHFPKLRIMVRALSRDHEYQMIEHEVDYAIHQHAGSAIKLAESALVCLGFRAHRASRAAKAFARHDRKVSRQVAEVRDEESVYISRVREGLAEMEEQFKQDRHQWETDVDAAWDTVGLRGDTEEEIYTGSGVADPPGDRPR